MWRIELDAQDLMEMRFSISPMEHLLVGAAASCGNDRMPISPTKGRWWRSVRQRVPQRAGPFLALCQVVPGFVPDFLVSGGPVGQIRRFSDELEAVAATPANVISADLDYYGARRIPSALARLRDHDQRELRRIVDGARALFDSCLADDWPGIRRILQGDIAHRAQLMASQGTGVMLHSLHPKLALRQQTVLLAVHPAAPDGRKRAGRGLDLRPNLFMEKGTVGGTLNDRDTPAVCYPATGATSPEPRGRDPLVALVGQGRARALRAISDGAISTVGLARRLGVTPPTASEHASALRNAGLITTQRDGQEVRHELTAIGLSLVAANRASTRWT